MIEAEWLDYDTTEEMADAVVLWFGRRQTSRPRQLHEHHTPSDLPGSRRRTLSRSGRGPQLSPQQQEGPRSPRGSLYRQYRHKADIRWHNQLVRYAFQSGSR
jgi:hypothetical protein